MSRVSFSGRNVVITGSARGIGLATAQAVSRAGANVTLADVDGALAKEEAARIGGAAQGLAVDVTDEQSFADLLTAAAGRHGPVDVLINNAGIMPIGPFLDEPVGVARRVFEVSVIGALTGMKAVLPGMVDRGRGHVVNLASAAGKAPVPGGISYAAAKAAVISLTESARVEFAGSGVRFTCVMPSFTNTDLIAGTRGTRGVRTVEPGEVADAIRRAVERGEKDVYMPRIVGPVLRSQSLLGRPLRDRLNRVLGTYSAFLEVDEHKRQVYVKRIGM